MINRDIFEYNAKLIAKIKTNSFDEYDLTNLAASNGIKIKNILINGVKDDSFFNTDANNKIFKLPLKSFALVKGGKNNQTFLIRIKKITNTTIEKNSENYEKYRYETLIDLRKNIYASFDQYLDQKYKIEINQQTIERLKNYFSTR